MPVANIAYGSRDSMKRGGVTTNLRVVAPHATFNIMSDDDDTYLVADDGVYLEFSQVGENTYRIVARATLEVG